MPTENDGKQALIDEIIADLASGLVDASDDEIEAELASYGDMLSPQDIEEIMDTIYEVRGADTLADEDAERGKAHEMANEDNTDVTVTEEDVDNDGDTDTITVSKSSTEDDNGTDDDESTSDEGNSDTSEDKPHDVELSDARKKRVERMKNNWGKTNTQKKREAERQQQQQKKEDDSKKKKDENSTNGIALWLSNYKY